MMRVPHKVKPSGVVYRSSRSGGVMTQLITSVSSGVPAALEEVRTLGRTLKKRAADVLAYFDRPGTSNGPTEAICESGPGWSGTGRSGWMSVVSNRV